MALLNGKKLIMVAALLGAGALALALAFTLRSGRGEAQPNATFAQFNAFTATQLGSLQVKLTYLGSQDKVTQTVVITSTTGTPDVSKFTPFYRPGIGYGNDTQAPLTCAAATSELEALIDKAGELPAVTNGDVAAVPFLSFSMFNNVAGDKVFEDIADKADAKALLDKMASAVSANQECLGALGLQWRLMGMGPHPLLDVEQVSLSLVQGWNLLSLPVAGTSPSQLFADILDNLSIAWALDASAAPSGKWRSFSPDVPPFLNDLTDIDQTMGFFAFMDEADTLSASGLAPLSTDVPLVGGRFNLIGYPARAARPVTEVLAGIAFSIVCTYDSQDQADPWKCFDPDVPPFLNDLAQMEPGRGYFIFPEASATLHVPG